MITAKLSPYCKLLEVEVFEFETYEEFFKFYMKYHDKGIIFGVKEVTKDD